MASGPPKRPPPAPPKKPRRLSQAQPRPETSTPECSGDAPRISLSRPGPEHSIRSVKAKEANKALTEELSAALPVKPELRLPGSRSSLVQTKWRNSQSVDAVNDLENNSSSLYKRPVRSDSQTTAEGNYGSTNPWLRSVTNNPYATREITSEGVFRTMSGTSSVVSSPDECFVEMLTLHRHGRGTKAHVEWHETARWIKYEEEFEADVGRWGHPQVSSLNFGSLRTFQRMFSVGDALLLDVPPGACFSYHSVLLSISDQLHRAGALSGSEAREFREVLISPYVHHEQLARAHANLTAVSSFLKHRGSGKSRKQQLLHVHRPSPKEPARRAESLGVTTTPQEQVLRQTHKPLRRSSTDIPLSGGHNNRDSTGKSTCVADYPVKHQAHGYESIDGDIVSKQALSRNSSGDSSGSADRLVAHQPHIAQIYHEISVAQEELLMKLPVNAESAGVLVGEVDFLTSPLVVLVRLAVPCVLGDFIEIPLPTRYIAIVLAPKTFWSTSCVHELGRAFSTLLADSACRLELEKASVGEHVCSLVDTFLDSTVVVQHGNYEDTLLLHGIKDQLPMTDDSAEREIRNTRRRQPKKTDEARHAIDRSNDDPLARSGRPFGGMILDLRRLGRRYLSDFRDAMNIQCVITMIVMYFGMIAPLIAFGSLLGEKTYNSLGLGETLISASFGGVVFALFAGQPMMFISVTGPMAVFETAVYRFCADYDIDFLAFRFWTGMWLFIVLLIIVATDSSHFIRRFTQFTEETFTALVAFIFIYESISTIFKTFVQHPILKLYPCSADQCLNSTLDAVQEYAESANCTTSPWNMTGLLSTLQGLNYSNNQSGVLEMSANQPNTALFYMLLVFGTFSLAYLLRSLKTSHYMTKYSRRFFGDMAIFVSIILMFLLTKYVFSEVHVTNILVPSGVSPSLPRAWLVDPRLAMSPKLVFGAALPGILVAFLIFVETQVTCLLTCNSEFKLKKTGGFHWNLMVTALLSLVCSILGLPWLCGQPVTSVIHTQSLLKWNTRVAPGDKPSVEGAYEQRVTAILINMLVGVSLAPPIASILSHVPKGIVMGIFLYMGVCNVLSLQFLRRVVLLLVPAKHHPTNSPDCAFTRHVSTLRMHLFTVVQLGCFATLVACKMTKLGIAFPLVLGMMVPIRDYLLTRFWSPRELKALDPH